MPSSVSTDALEQISQHRSTSLTTIVREAIEGMIISRELAAGDRVNESELAKRLNVSRGPIREACRSMEQAGLLVSIANRGVFVREMTLDEVRDLYEVRGALSGLAGRLAAEKAGKEPLRRLESYVDQMDTAAIDEDVDTYFTLNLKFHDHVLHMADNPALFDNYRAVTNQISLFRRYGLFQKGSLKISNKEHRAILDAIKSGDADASEMAMRHHVAGGWARLSAAV